jgi:hypothetical protein
MGKELRELIETRVPSEVDAYTKQEADDRFAPKDIFGFVQNRADLNTYPMGLRHEDRTVVVRSEGREYWLRGGITNAHWRVKSLRPEDIVDDLTSEDTDKPLSARQGKILRGIIDNMVVSGANEIPSSVIEQILTNTGFQA